MAQSRLRRMARLRRIFRLRLAMLVAALAAVSMVSAGPMVNRARPPKWTASTLEVFFPDARQKLVGTRPAPGTRIEAPAAGGSPTDTATADGGFAWSKVISAEVIEDEVKAIQARLVTDVANATEFKGGGYKTARLHFSMLAVLFAIASEYDADVRWKAQAAGVRDILARAGFNCKVGTDQSLKEARARSEDLKALIQGSPIEARPAERKTKWDTVANRQPLMQRLEQAQQQGLTVWASSEGEFSKNNEKFLHEAELIAALAEVIQREGFEFTDDQAYLDHARKLSEHAREASDAAKQKNYGGARQATGAIDKACSACHEAYRG